MSPSARSPSTWRSSATWSMEELMSVPTHTWPASALPPPQPAAFWDVSRTEGTKQAFRCLTEKRCVYVCDSGPALDHQPRLRCFSPQGFVCLPEHERCLLAGREKLDCISEFATQVLAAASTSTSGLFEVSSVGQVHNLDPEYAHLHQQNESLKSGN